MLITELGPIPEHWTIAVPFASCGSSTFVAAHEVARNLATVEAGSPTASLHRHLAACADELALATGSRCRYTTADPTVALVRSISIAARRCPNAGGPLTARLDDELRRGRHTEVQDPSIRGVAR